MLNNYFNFKPDGHSMQRTWEKVYQSPEYWRDMRKGRTLKNRKATKNV